jgi:aspartate/methionine/tyrosine aminotransferase
VGELPADIPFKAIDKLLMEKHIFLTPGTIFGSNGEGYIRFSLCITEEKIQEAITRITN